MNILTREKYKEIKRMDRQHMENFLQDLCGQYYNNGVVAMTSELVERVDTGIKNTKGIGEKRYQELMDNINKELTREEKKE